MDSTLPGLVLITFGVVVNRWPQLLAPGGGSDQERTPPRPVGHAVTSLEQARRLALTGRYGLQEAEERSGPDWRLSCRFRVRTFGIGGLDIGRRPYWLEASPAGVVLRDVYDRDWIVEDRWNAGRSVVWRLDEHGTWQREASGEGLCPTCHLSVNRTD